MSKKKPEWVDILEKHLTELEKRIGILENRIREWTRPDPELWYWETLTIVVSNIFVACIVASVSAYGFEKMMWAGAMIIYGIAFINIRWIVGRRIQAPPRLIRGLTAFLILIIILGIVVLIFGMIQVGWIHLN